MRLVNSEPSGEFYIRAESAMRKKTGQCSERGSLRASESSILFSSECDFTGG
jgi:hypothetical protein